MNQFHKENATPKGDWIWVFASDQAGRHSSGYAKIAKVNFGARYGLSKGLQGSAFAIETHGRTGPVPVGEILSQIEEFLVLARTRARQQFYVTRLHAPGLTPQDEARLAEAFRGAPSNCSLPEVWKEHLQAQAQR